MSFTYVLTTSVGKVRLLIRDTREAYAFFEDDEITAFLDMNPDPDEVPQIRYAAADALDTWASDEVMVTKAVKVLDIGTSGPAVAQALRDHANKLRELAEIGSSDDAGFDWAEMSLGVFSEREQLVNRLIRDD